jgi:DNA-binding CsgD family transcriptional regulator
MTASDSLSEGRAAFEEHRWRAASGLLSAADGDAPLEAEDLERLALAAYMAGDESGWTSVMPRAHDSFRARGELTGAARCAFWLGFGFINNGDFAPAGGWFARAQRLVDDAGVDCPERGYLLLPEAIQGIDDAPGASYEAFRRAEEVGERFADRDLVALARHGQGRALIRMGEHVRAMALLDEVLVAVTSGETSPLLTGDIYCGVIEACHETLDVRRAREWTAALARWCEAQPEMVAFQGQCLVYRSSVMQLGGAWSAALQEATAACQRLSEPRAHPAAGSAYYQKAEIHRVRGEFAAAEEAYRLADEHGRQPQPGLAQLRLAQGRADVAAASIRRVLHEAHDRLTRARTLPAAVEILLAVGDIDAARETAVELSALAAAFGSRFLDAAAAQASGAVALAEGDCEGALRSLRAAYARWRELGVPHEAARARLLIAVGCRQLGDLEGAEMEREASRRAFEELGAAPDLAAMAQERGATSGDAGLTAREVDILRLVAAGRTNRAIADELVISEKTVARHVSNIFGKLGLPNRAAATAYAYEHDLV